MSSSGASIQILLVEDSVSDAETMVAHLSSSTGGRYEVLVASTLENAILALRGSAFDLILLDLSLPDAEGFQALQMLRRKRRSTPIVVCVSPNEVSVADDALRLGAQDFLVKGQATTDTILRSIRYAFERMSLESEAQAARGLLEAQSAGRETYRLRRDGELFPPFSAETTPVATLAELFSGETEREILGALDDALTISGMREISLRVEVDGGGFNATFLLVRINDEEALLILSTRNSLVPPPA